MGLSMRAVGDDFTPLVICDVCEQPITDWAMGAIVSEPPAEDAIVAVRIAHKGRCHDSLEARLSTQGWEELTSYMARLLWNSGCGSRQVNENPRGQYDYLVIQVPKPCF